MTAPPQVIEEQVAPPRRDLGIVRALGVLVSAVATLVTALVELYLTPLRLAGVPIGVAVVFAAVANWALAWFAVHTTGRRRAAAVPWVLWTVLMLFAAGTRTTEGDYLIGGNDWVALIMILVGSLSFAVYAYRLIMRRRPL
ncbi:hypothetical protein AB0M20_01020 [Actinoplanes sp. NPDC051633]|uniref:hypothetical protein n=1 Tax=Actinoplanes sp. NPDC051633 TaxID=3155670 RepID=UPI00342159AA